MGPACIRHFIDKKSTTGHWLQNFLKIFLKCLLDGASPKETQTICAYAQPRWCQARTLVFSDGQIAGTLLYFNPKQRGNCSPAVRSIVQYLVKNGKGNLSKRAQVPMAIHSIGHPTKTVPFCCEKLHRRQIRHRQQLHRSRQRLLSMQMMCPAHKNAVYIA
jgi:hypothetical protein